MTSKSIAATSLRRSSTRLAGVHFGLFALSLVACGNGRPSADDNNTGGNAGNTGGSGNANNSSGGSGGSSGADTSSHVGPIDSVSPDKVAPGLNVDYYEGSYDVLPDFAQLTPVASAVASNLSAAVDLTVDVGLGIDLTDNAVDNFALRYSGLLRAAVDGDYTFGLASDDGSRLLIGGKVVVDNDHIHEDKLEMIGTATLEAGFYSIEVQYFENGGGQSLKLNWTPPDKGKLVLRQNTLYHECTSGADCVDASTIGGGAGGAGGAGGGSSTGEGGSAGGGS